MRSTFAYRLLCWGGVAAALGLCACSPSKPSSAPANQSYVQPSSAPPLAPPSGAPAAGSRAAGSPAASATPPSGLTVVPPSRRAASPARAYRPREIYRLHALSHHRWRHRHSSTDGERG